MKGSMVGDATYPAILPMRNQIRREIESIEPFDAQESGHRDDALVWIGSASAPAPAAATGPPICSRHTRSLRIDNGYALTYATCSWRAI